MIGLRFLENAVREYVNPLTVEIALVDDSFAYDPAIHKTEADITANEISDPSYSRRKFDLIKITRDQGEFTIELPANPKWLRVGTRVIGGAVVILTGNTMNPILHVSEQRRISDENGGFEFTSTQILKLKDWI